MKYYRIKCEIYKAEGKAGNEWQKNYCCQPFAGEERNMGEKWSVLYSLHSVRIIGNITQRSFLEQWVDNHFVSPRPVLSLVAQKPLVGELVMEVHSLPATVGEEVTVEEQMASSVRYLRVTSGHYREIIAGGLYADDLTLPVREQSEQVFGKAEEILKAEQMSLR